MTDYRALCARMADELDHYRQLLMDDRRETHALATEARAALAQPEPQGPSEAELKTFACEWWHSFGFAKDKATCTWVIDHVAPEHFADFSRDVLARWGRPATKPVPVAERLPRPEDCDPSSQCWWFTPSEEKWIFWPIKWASPECSHWLPAHALPVPQQGGRP